MCKWQDARCSTWPFIKTHTDCETTCPAEVFCQATAEEVQAALLGKKVTGVIRKGKYFWFELGSGPALLVHFGMAGHLKVRTYALHGLCPSACACAC